MTVVIDFNSTIQGINQDETVDSILRMALTNLEVDVCSSSILVFSTLDSGGVTLDAKALGIKALTFVAYASNYPVDLAVAQTAVDNATPLYSGNYAHSLIKFYTSVDDLTFAHSNYDFIKLKPKPNVDATTITAKLYVGGKALQPSSTYNLT